MSRGTQHLPDSSDLIAKVGFQQTVFESRTTECFVAAETDVANDIEERIDSNFLVHTPVFVAVFVADYAGFVVATGIGPVNFDNRIAVVGHSVRLHAIQQANFIQRKRLLIGYVDFLRDTAIFDFPLFRHPASIFGL